MPRGGWRPGAGRKPGASSKPKEKKQRVAETVDKELPVIDHDNLPPPLPDNPITPLDYMLRVLNDPKSPRALKEKMAALAAPYVHPRVGKSGKKQDRQSAAKEAAKGKFAPMAGPKVVGIKRGE